MKLDWFNSPDLAVFTTRDFARLAGVSVSAASRQLTRLRHDNRALLRLTRGIWANASHPHFSAPACVPVLLGSEQGYVSFLTALHMHGAISQIPATIQVATTGHARKLRTAIATFEFLQLKPEMLGRGVEWSDSPRPFRIATVEKALLDTFYISTRKNRRFAKLPEMQLQDANFDVRRYRKLVAEHQFPPQVAAAMEGKLNETMQPTAAGRRSWRTRKRGAGG